MVSLEDFMKVLSPDNRRWMESQSPEQQKEVLGFFQDSQPSITTGSLPGPLAGLSSGLDAGAANAAVEDVRTMAERQ
ncbi:hypothetical protein [Streptomyces sp. NPDC046261]|uniref:hypothetical protein n=1 Tax=Streptomyces sp. NPDC046261 TaxID=3157200 RepID=UPI003404BDC2